MMLAKFIKVMSQKINLNHNIFFFNLTIKFTTNFHLIMCYIYSDMTTTMKINPHETTKVIFFPSNNSA